MLVNRDYFKPEETVSICMDIGTLFYEGTGKVGEDKYIEYLMFSTKATFSHFKTDVQRKIKFEILKSNMIFFKQNRRNAMQELIR